MVKLKNTNTECQLSERLQFLLKEIKRNHTVHNVKSSIITVSLLIVLCVIMSFLCSYNSTRIISADIQPGYVSVNETVHHIENAAETLNTCGSKNPFVAYTANETDGFTHENATAADIKADKASQLRGPEIFQTGVASHMGHGLHGRIQANGTKHDKNSLICAHRTLPFGTVIKVTNGKNGKSVNVRVTDRGPYVSGRIVDLSLAAANRIGIKDEGIGHVNIEIIKKVDRDSGHYDDE